MQIKMYEIPSKRLAGYAESPSVSCIQVRKKSVLVGTAFSAPLLQEIHFSDDFSKATKVEDQELDSTLEGDAVAILNGLRSSGTGDTVLAVLHPGSISPFIKNIFGRNLAKKSGTELMEFLAGDDQGMGFWLRHSLIQVSKGEFTARHFREAGVMWDGVWMGDFVFGISGSTLIREPYLYLNFEKRETLRKELFSNFGVHWSEDGIIWALGQNMRLVRFVSTESKAKPTPLKLPGAQSDLPESGFALSSYSNNDGWLYGTSGGSKILFRVRRNPITQEEELQELHKFEDRITGLTVLETEEKSTLYWTTEAESGAQLHRAALPKPEDQELMPAVPEFETVGLIGDFKTVSALTAGTDGHSLWLGEGRMGSVLPRSDNLRILRISDI